MTSFVVTSSRAGLALESPISQHLMHDLISYIVGFYEGLFAGAKARYPGAKADFVYEVLKSGYGLREVDFDGKSASVVSLDGPLPGSTTVAAQHLIFHDQNAWRYMVSTFSALL